MVHDDYNKDLEYISDLALNMCLYECIPYREVMI